MPSRERVNRSTVPGCPSAFHRITNDPSPVDCISCPWYIFEGGGHRNIQEPNTKWDSKTRIRTRFDRTEPFVNEFTVDLGPQEMPKIIHVLIVIIENGF